MGSYIEHNLIPGEKLMYETRMHWITFASNIPVALFFSGLAIYCFNKGGGWTLLGFLPIIFVVPCLVGIVHRYLAYLTTELSMTTKRVVIKTGVIGRQIQEVQFSRLESLLLDQSALGRMMDFGTVIIKSIGGTREGLFVIPRPKEMQNKYHEILDGDA
jgi:uncharacterized membrane protein YdbT with pleckstrin-like domain